MCLSAYLLPAGVCVYVLKTPEELG